MIHILFASETGNAEEIARDTQKHLRRLGHETTVLDMDDSRVTDLDGMNLCLAVVSTWGEGEPPSTGEDFYEELLDTPSDRFSKLKFSVYALGDRSYEDFCQFGHDLDAALHARGAQRVLPVVENDSDPEECFEDWLAALEGHLKTEVAIS
ncbi:MAG: flavodoxin domain-containing protein [Verrucomicrobiota bacterium]